MNSDLFDVLHDVNEGIVFLKENLEICFWNNYMERITHKNSEKVINKKIYEVMPSFNTNYINEALKDSMKNGHKAFFSAAIHKELINSNRNLNLKISRFEKNKCKFLILEFIDVTNQFAEISILKNYVHKLCKLNNELKEKEKTIRRLAYYDKLTGVANRTLFYEFAEKFLTNAKRNNSLLGLMFIDIDKFKSINDTYGHKIGDEVLIKVANILSEATRKNDVVARYGGDEFLILMTNVGNLDDYKTIVSRIINSKNKNFNLNGKEFNISLSIGISFYPNDGNCIDNLIIKADKAMYTAKKRSGEDCIEYNLC